MRVLVIEDEPAMASVLRRGLSENGLAVDVAGTGRDGLWLAGEHDYEAIVLDLGLPDLEGLTLLDRLRSEGRWMPVLVLTARDGVPDRVAGLDMGADDYLVKPFAFAELLARLRAVVRRGVLPRPAVLTAGDLALDPAARTVRRAGAPVHVTPHEFALLECLLRRPGEVVSRAEIVRQVWDFAFEADSNVVEVHVANLRRKIDGAFARHSLETVRGVGYRIRDDRVQA